MQHAWLPVKPGLNPMSTESWIRKTPFNKPNFETRVTKLACRDAVYGLGAMPATKQFFCISGAHVSSLAPEQALQSKYFFCVATQ